jgi:hypothetical protein
LYKGGRASTSQINFSESNIVHKNLNAALGQPNETPECRLHNERLRSQRLPRWNRLTLG